MNHQAIEVQAPGRLALVRRATPSPAEDEVLLAVEACGICGADRGDIENADPALRRVPGHEVIGRILAKGARVPEIWRLGQRVGVGRFGGPCQTCPACRSGHLNLCRNQPIVEASCDGGYAERMIARATGLVSVPDELSSEEAAPILCAGLATFNGLRASGAQPGDTVAVLGIGGLGHMALQYARRMGFRTVAVGRGQDIASAVERLGAHRYVDTDTEDAVAVLTELGGAQAILTTIGDAAAVSDLIPGLAPGGRMILLGIGKDPLAVSMGQIVGGERAIIGSVTGSPYESERALEFSALTGAHPRIETMPLERAQDAYDRIKSGDVQFRMVLVMKGQSDADK